MRCAAAFVFPARARYVMPPSPCTIGSACTWAAVDAVMPCGTAWHEAAYESTYRMACRDPKLLDCSAQRHCDKHTQRETRALRFHFKTHAHLSPWLLHMS